MITADQKLELTVDYGWLTPLSSPLFWLMTYINKVFHNWGVSILLLTLLVKLAFYPLSAASYKSMARMKKLGPRMKTLKESVSPSFFHRRVKDTLLKMSDAQLSPAIGLNSQSVLIYLRSLSKTVRNGISSPNRWS